jgi:hypothetical protein
MPSRSEPGYSWYPLGQVIFGHRDVDLAAYRYWSSGALEQDEDGVWCAHAWLGASGGANGNGPTPGRGH